MNRYIGIAKEVNDPWYMINVMLYNRMIKLTLYTLKYKKPKYYYYNREEFDHCVNEQEITEFKWFLGASINCL